MKQYISKKCGAIASTLCSNRSKERRDKKIFEALNTQNFPKLMGTKIEFA